MFMQFERLSHPATACGGKTANLAGDNASTTQEPQRMIDAARFEAGTSSVADAVRLGAAINYLNHLGINVTEIRR